MKPALIVAFLWLLFAGPHIGLATSRVRGFLVERLGVWGFAYLFSAVAAVTFSLLVHYYAGARFDGVAGLDLARFPAFRYVAIGAIVLAFVLMIGSLWRLPASALSGVDPRALVPRGLERITRHPFFVGAGLLGLSHALLAAHLVGTVMFAGVAFLSFAGAMHQDRKLRALRGEGYDEYLAQTSFLPFVAIASGRQQLAWREMPWVGLAAGLVTAFVLRSVHSSILATGGLWVITVVLGGAASATIQALARRRRPATVLQTAAESARR